MIFSWLSKLCLPSKLEDKYAIKALAVTMTSLAGASLGLGVFALVVAMRFDEAVVVAQRAALESYEQRTWQALLDPALSPQYQDALLKVELMPQGLRTHKLKFIGPKDIALKDEVKLIKVKGQKKKLSQDVSAVRFIPLED